jgi:CRISPR-associated protein Cas2
MMVVVAYDVSTQDQAGRRRLRRVAKTCQNRGIRVQFSLFECELDPAQWAVLRAELSAIIDPDKDSLRFYFLGSGKRHKVEHLGAKQPLDLDAPLIL